MFIPYVTEDTAKCERSMDIYSRLLADRIIFIGSEINDAVANAIVAQMIFLRANDPKKGVNIYINSPGGAVHAGLAIYDTIQYIKPKVATLCVGMAASAGSMRTPATASRRCRR